MSKLSFLKGLLAASGARRARRRASRARRRRAISRRPRPISPTSPRRSPNGTARPSGRRRRARSSCLSSRPTSATAARRARATARRKPPRRSAGNSASSTARAPFPRTRSALTQAIALKPDGIILGGIDAKEQQPVVEQAAGAGHQDRRLARRPEGRARSTAFRRCSPT